jgi:hypothetical protein
MVVLSLNNNCSAHERGRGPKLVWLEPSGHEDSEMSEKIFSSTSVNVTAEQNVWRHNFLQPGVLSKVGETVAHIWPQVVEIAPLQEFYKNDRFLTAPLWRYMAHILRGFHTFDFKSHRKNHFIKDLKY